jgi:hypothetical protein
LWNDIGQILKLAPIYKDRLNFTSKQVFVSIVSFKFKKLQVKSFHAYMVLDSIQTVSSGDINIIYKQFNNFCQVILIESLSWEMKIIWEQDLYIKKKTCLFLIIK